MTSRRTVIRAGVAVVLAVGLRQSWMTFRRKDKMTSPDGTTDSADSPAEPHSGIAPLVPVSVDVSYGIAPMQNGEGEGAFLRPTVEGLALIAFEYHETHPAIREVSLGARITRRTVPVNATDVRVPQRNGPFFSDLRRHIVWREGRTVKTLINTGEEFALTLPFDVAELVTPAMKPVGGTVEVLALAANRRQLALVRFFDKSDPVLVWTIDMPVAAAFVTCALGPASSGSERHIAIVGAPSDGALTLGLSRFSGDQAAPFTMHSVNEVRPVTNARPGLHASGDGRLTVGLLVQRSSGSLALFETRVTGNQHQDVLHDVGTFTEPVVGGAVLYTSNALGELSRRDAAMVLGDGTVMRIGADGGATRALMQGRVVDHVNLVPGRQGPFILYFDPDRGPRLEAF